MPSWFWWGLLALPICALILPHLVIRLIGGGYYTIPSTSMLPTLPVGSAFLATPMSPKEMPERGDIIVFRNPPQAGVDYVQRVIGLPGDRVAMRGGVVWLNGEVLQRSELPNFETMARLGTGGSREHCEANMAGLKCSFPQWRETLPDGRSHAVLDLGTSRMDEFAEVEVPKGHFFALGDNRDNSVDSRFPKHGMIPLGTIQSRAWRFWLNFSDPIAHLDRFGSEVR